jgi:hypothetical protein
MGLFKALQRFLVIVVGARDIRLLLLTNSTVRVPFLMAESTEIVEFFVLLGVPCSRSIV